MFGPEHEKTEFAHHHPHRVSRVPILVEFVLSRLKFHYLDGAILRPKNSCKDYKVSSQCSASEDKSSLGSIGTFEHEAAKTTMQCKNRSTAPWVVCKN